MAYTLSVFVGGILVGRLPVIESAVIDGRGLVLLDLEDSDGARLATGEAVLQPARAPLEPVIELRCTCGASVAGIAKRDTLALAAHAACKQIEISVRGPR